MCCLKWPNASEVWGSGAAEGTASVMLGVWLAGEVDVFDQPVLVKERELWQVC